MRKKVVGHAFRIGFFFLDLIDLYGMNIIFGGMPLETNVNCVVLFLALFSITINFSQKIGNYIICLIYLTYIKHHILSIFAFSVLCNVLA